MSNSQRYPVKLCLVKYEFDNNAFNFENWLFLIVVSLKNDLRISAAGKNMEIVLIKHY